MKQLSPSILSADFSILGQEIIDVTRPGVPLVHFDVMDGLFVPNISIGIPVLKSVRQVTDLALDVHLMIVEPVRYVDAFIDAGADLLTIHVEADTPENIKAALLAIKARGKKAGLSLKPATPALALEPYLDLLDLVLIMTVEPGFGGQSFLENQLPKIRQTAELLEKHCPNCLLSVDGGIDQNTIAPCHLAGANVFVAGSAIFGQEDRGAAIARLLN